MWIVFTLGFLGFFSSVFGQERFFKINRESLDTFRENLHVGRILFGSCCDEAKPQPFWKMLQNEKPDIWLWLGDTVYSKCNAFKCLQDSYSLMKKNEQYQQFTISVPFIDGTWDDHDYGLNDAGTSLPFKNASQVEFLNFLNVTSPKRLNRHGVFSSHLFPIASSDGTRGYMKIIILDTRFSRDQPLMLHRLGSYAFPLSNKLAVILRFFTWTFKLPIYHNGEILDADQWEWLETQFRENQVDDGPVVMNLLLSSIQVLSESPILESWYWYPASKRRLIKLIQDTNPRGLHILSGDIHLAQFLGAVNCVPEITSSGMTHSIADHQWLGKVVQKLIMLFQLPFFPNGNASSSENLMLPDKNYGEIVLNLSHDGLNITGRVISFSKNNGLQFNRFLSNESIMKNDLYKCLDNESNFFISSPIAIAALQTIFLLIFALSGYSVCYLIYKIAREVRFLFAKHTPIHRSGSFEKKTSGSYRDGFKTE